MAVFTVGFEDILTSAARSTLIAQSHLRLGDKNPQKSQSPMTSPFNDETRCDRWLIYIVIEFGTLYDVSTPSGVLGNSSPSRNRSTQSEVF